MAISRDGSTIAAGAPQYSGNAGAVYIFTFDGTTWAQTAKISKPSGMSSLFGNDVALSGDGSKLLVGAPGLISTEQGGAAFFGRNADGTWSLKTTMAGGANNSKAGTGVAISDDGPRAAVGIPNFKSGSTTTPRVNTYSASGTSWTSLATVANPSGISGLSEFGHSVSFSSDGTRLAVGAPGVTTVGTTSVAGARAPS